MLIFGRLVCIWIVFVRRSRTGRPPRIEGPSRAHWSQGLDGTQWTHTRPVPHETRPQRTCGQSISRLFSYSSVSSATGNYQMFCCRYVSKGCSLADLGLPLQTSLIIRSPLRLMRLQHLQSARAD